jgi:hypothetical protein
MAVTGREHFCVRPVLACVIRQASLPSYDGIMAGCCAQMEQQPSFDPLSQPDMLAALTRPTTALNSWTSFDEPSQPPSQAASVLGGHSSRSLNVPQVRSRPGQACTT